jgi:hypothetical protein
VLPVPVRRRADPGPTRVASPVACSGWELSPADGGTASDRWADGLVAASLASPWPAVGATDSSVPPDGSRGTSAGGTAPAGADALVVPGPRSLLKMPAPLAPTAAPCDLLALRSAVFAQTRPNEPGSKVIRS